MSKFSFAAKEKKEKKPLTPAQQTAKTVINWVVTILCLAIIIVALVISIMTITRTTSGKGIAHIGKTAFFAVQTGSMSGTFEADDLILVTMYDGDGSDLQIGQVISFKAVVNSYEIIKTHRIVDVNITSSGYQFRTKGDAEASADSGFVAVDKIVATWGTPAASVGAAGEYKFDVNESNMGKNWGQIGKVINKLQNDRTVYFLVIILPLILLFVIYAFYLVRTFVIAKLARVKEETRQEASAASNELSEEDKKRLAMEYLAELAAKSGQPVPDAAALSVDASGEKAEDASDSKSDDLNTAEPAAEIPAEEPATENSEKKEDAED